MWAWCHVDVKVKYRAVGVTKVTEPREAPTVSQIEAPEPEMLWDLSLSLKHMLAIFTDDWGKEGENGSQRRRSFRGVKGYGGGVNGGEGGSR